MHFGSKITLLKFMFFEVTKAYEIIDKILSKVALPKFSQYLRYLTNKIVILLVFGDEVHQEMNVNIVKNLTKKCIYYWKMIHLARGEMFDSLYG